MNIFDYTDTSRDYAQFLVEKNYDAGTILTQPIIGQLGYILQYLASKYIFILSDEHYVIVYTTGKDNKTREFVKKAKEVTIVNEKERSDDLIVNYTYAISKAFDFLEIPF